MCARSGGSKSGRAPEMHLCTCKRSVESFSDAAKHIRCSCVRQKQVMHAACSMQQATEHTQCMPCKHLCTLGGRRRSLARNAVTARKCATVGPHAAGLGNMHVAPVCRVAWYAAEGHSHACTVHSSATRCCRARGVCSRKLHHHRNQQRSHRRTVSASVLSACHAISHSLASFLQHNRGASA